MKATRILIATALFGLAASFAFAGPGPAYFAARRAARDNPTLVVTASMPKPGETCCRTVTKQRPIASHKVTMPVKSVECSGCAAMAAGRKCPAL